jgi:hypothetical protein
VLRSMAPPGVSLGKEKMCCLRRSWVLSRFTCVASFRVQYKSTNTDQAEDALDAHGNADLEIAPPARIERFNALREMQRGHYKSTMLTLLGAQFTCFTGTKVQILKYWYKSTNNRMRVA